MFTLPASSPYVPPEGSWGFCPECECGGRERPCWYCGYDGAFKSGVGTIIYANPRGRVRPL